MMGVAGDNAQGEGGDFDYPRKHKIHHPRKTQVEMADQDVNVGGEQPKESTLGEYLFSHLSATSKVDVKDDPTVAVGVGGGALAQRATAEVDNPSIDSMETQRLADKVIDVPAAQNATEVATTDLLQNATTANHASPVQNTTQRFDTMLSGSSPDVQAGGENASINLTVNSLVGASGHPNAPQQSAGVNQDAQPSANAKVEQPPTTYVRNMPYAEKPQARNTTQPPQWLSALSMEYLNLWRSGFMLFGLLCFVVAGYMQTRTLPSEPRSKDDILAEIYARAQSDPVERLQRVSSALRQNAPQKSLQEAMANAIVDAQQKTLQKTMVVD